MMRKEKNLRLLVSGVLVLAAAAAGIGLYRSGEPKNDPKVQQEQLAQREEKAVTKEDSSSGASEYETPEALQKSADVSTPNAQADRKDDAVHREEKDDLEPEHEEASTGEVLPALDFQDDTVMEWPVQGDVLIDYSMDGSVYFPTLEVYKYNPAVILSAKEGQEIQAVAASKVVSVTENAETGVTVTMDMGNGFQAIYGQLKDVSVQPDQTLPAGAVIGKAAVPTKYYAKEGTNLYFAMTKDGAAVDPFLYLDTDEE